MKSMATLRPRLVVPHHVIPIGFTVSMEHNDALSAIMQIVCERLISKEDWEALERREKYLRLLQFQDDADKPEDRVCAVYLRPVVEMIKIHKDEHDWIATFIAEGNEPFVQTPFIGEISYSVSAFFFTFNKDGDICTISAPQIEGYFTDPTCILLDYLNWWREHGQYVLAPAGKLHVLASNGKLPELKSNEVFGKDIAKLTDMISKVEDVQALADSVDAQISAEMSEAKLNGGFAKSGIGAETTFMGFGLMQLQMFIRSVR